MVADNGLAASEMVYSRMAKCKMVKIGGKNRFKYVDTYAPLILAQAGRETSGEVKPVTRNKWDVGDTFRRGTRVWRIAAVCYRCHKETGWTRIEPVRLEGQSGVLPSPLVRVCRHGK